MVFKYFFNLLIILLLVNNIHGLNSKENLTKRQKYKWVVGVRELELIVALKEGNKNYLYKLLNLEQLNDKHYIDEIYEYFKDDTYYELFETFNVKHTCLLLGDQLFEFSNEGVSQYTYKKKDNDGWDWNKLGSIYNGETEVTPEELSHGIKEREKLGDDYSFYPDNYDFLCHNCQDFVQTCIKIIDSDFPSDKWFTFRTEQIDSASRLSQFTGVLSDPKFTEYINAMQNIYSCLNNSTNTNTNTNTNNRKRDLILGYEQEIYTKECPNRVENGVKISSSSTTNDEETFTVKYSDNPCLTLLTGNPPQNLINNQTGLPDDNLPNNSGVFIKKGKLYRKG
ncbi:hypothetical protein BCR32DRAFT_294987 [Anaeromyces robustus]|uniref:DUF862-domain-containing protein n=1 Tax=Anaeromyces robustus TaxID=1754192 RepID=A0A1Y1WYG4_9FUNG|nr:hypothetical protein BCR32DRAFT_294987 [Anaeromyces robustus]|eukprot:ORX78543.1 hypothetical protein BCR32DRAFT_294987 [Anaeromyces robustus]